MANMTAKAKAMAMARAKATTNIDIVLCSFYPLLDDLFKSLGNK